MFASGSEDSIWLGAGKLAQSNAAQVKTCARSSKALGLEIASPDEAREMLALKGGDKAGF